MKDNKNSSLKCFIFKNISKILISIGFGGVIAVYTYYFLINNLKPIYLESESFTRSDIFTTVIIFISFICLISFPFTVRDIKYRKYLAIMTLVILAMTLVGIFAFVYSEKIVWMFPTGLWLLSILSIWILIELLGSLYLWVQIPEPGSNNSKRDIQHTKFDLAKLTFIWGIIAFVFSLLLK